MIKYRHEDKIIIRETTHTYSILISPTTLFRELRNREGGRTYTKNSEYGILRFYKENSTIRNESTRARTVLGKMRAINPSTFQSVKFKCVREPRMILPFAKTSFPSFKYILKKERMKMLKIYSDNDTNDTLRSKVYNEPTLFQELKYHDGGRVFTVVDDLEHSLIQYYDDCYIALTEMYRWQEDNTPSLYILRHKFSNQRYTKSIKQLWKTNIQIRGIPVFSLLR